MDRIRKLFLLLAVVASLHMVEQLAFGIGEIARIWAGLGAYYALFENADRATVILVTIAGGGVLLCAGGRAGVRDRKGRLERPFVSERRLDAGARGLPASGGAERCRRRTSSRRFA